MKALSLLSVLLTAAPAFAQNPCTAPADLAYRPTTLYVELPNFNATIPTQSGTTPEFDEVEIGWFLDAAAASPVSSSVIPRAGLKSAGVVDCYTASLASVPTAARFAKALVRRTAADPASSGWSALSNSFFTAAALAPPASTRVR